jgi:hypothetical protein
VGNTKDWISFEEEGMSPSGKTKVWRVTDIGGGLLGTVKWYAPWRKYAFWPEYQTIYEQDCLRQISTFIDEETKMHKALCEGSGVVLVYPNKCSKCGLDMTAKVRAGHSGAPNHQRGARS